MLACRYVRGKACWLILQTRNQGKILLLHNILFESTGRLSGIATIIKLRLLIHPKMVIITITCGCSYTVKSHFDCATLLLIKGAASYIYLGSVVTKRARVVYSEDLADQGLQI